jgi:uncharacterized protein (TIGR02271 family)
MFNDQEARQLIGADLYASSDQKVGRIGHIYLDDQTGQPEWATVNTGFFGTSESLVPLQGAQRVSAGLAVPFPKEQIKDAPSVDPSDGHLEEEAEAELYRYYGLAYSESRSDSGLPDEVPAAGVTEPDIAAQRDDEGLVRSEEQLHVGKEQVHRGTARLRKYVVTEEQNVSVPVQREQVRLETEPLTGEDQRLGDEISEGVTEVTLSEERPVVHTETVAKERVGLVKEVQEEQHTVSEDVRKEQIEAEGEIDR